MLRLRVPEIEDTIMFSLRWNFSASIVLALLVVGTQLRVSLGMKYGTNIRYAKAPWMVFILDKNVHGNVPICGGVIIGKYHILTAAHCVNDRFGSIKVVKADYYSSASPKLRLEPTPVDAFKEYKNRGTTNWVDIAVITLKSPITTGKVGSGIMNLPSWNVSDGFEGKLFGSRDQKPRLQEMNVYIKDKSEACKIVPLHGGFEIFGTLRGNAEIGSGDGGDPLIYNNEVVGILSVVSKYASEKSAIFTRVEPYKAWIECVMENIEKLC